MTPFQRFLLAEMKKRRMSQRRFAAFVGINQATLSNHLQYLGEPPAPSLDMLVKIAEKTGTGVARLLQLAYPSLPSELVAGTNPNVQAIAEKIAKLPPAQQEFLDKLIISLIETEKDT